jgi:hypothetical protein
MDHVHQTRERIEQDEREARLLGRIATLNHALAEALGDLGWREGVEAWIERVERDDEGR